MAVDIALYRDREHSYIKHKFLTQYLQAAAYKIMRGYPTFNFVDAFAGPWRVSDEKDFSDASFDQAIKILEDVRDDLRKSGKHDPILRFCFCEINLESAAKLREYAEKHDQFEIHVFEGAFEDNLEKISKVLPNGFTFTFIDPTGWDIRSGEVFNFLKAQGGEFMLNFMADHINRHSMFSKVSASFGRFLDEPEWERQFYEMPEHWPNELRMLKLLKRKMKSSGIATYIPDFSIMVPRKERLKMRLILGTNSAKGLEVFRDIQGKVERQEIELRNQLRDEQNPTISLFSESDIAAMQQEEKGVGCRRYQELAKKLIQDHLRRERVDTFNSIAINVMDDLPMRMTQVKDLLKEMKKSGLVSYDLPSKKRTPQSDTRITLPTSKF